MKVAVMYSGGKDSNQALKWAVDSSHEVVALISVKPKSTDSFLYQYATVEWTRLSGEALGIPVIHLNSDKVGPREEADELEKVFRGLGADAILVGGVGLQETQIREWRRVARKFGMNLIVPYANLASEELLREEIRSGLDIMITSVASDGLGEDWLGKKITMNNFEQFKELSNRYGFDILGEGGYYDTLILDSPLFKKRIQVMESEKIWDGMSGYLVINNAKLISKGV